MNRFGKHAVVIGASIAGLLAARVLSDHYATVTLLERDPFPSDDRPRKGVPQGRHAQGRHAHGLLARGREVIEGYFPGLTDALVAGGAVLGDIASEVVWVGHGTRLATAPSGLIGLLVPRNVLEQALRERVLALPNVRGVERCAVRALLHDAQRGAVTGVRMAIDGAGEVALDADLVVDASGRGSAGPAWLASIGCGRVEEERVDIGIGYTTRTYRRRPGDLGGKLGVVVAGNAPNWRNGTVLFNGHDEWIVSIGGYFGDRAPADDAGFRAYAESLPAPEIHEIVARAEPLSDFATYSFAANLRRRYDRLAALPTGYLPFGDALCSFNPVYGQGMTVAAQEAVALDRCLRAGTARWPRQFLRQAAAIIDIPWGMAVGNDLRHPDVAAPRPASVRLINAYVARLYRAAADDPRLAHAFLAVANLMATPAQLLRPSIAWRVMTGGRPVAGGRGIVLHGAR